MDIGERIKRVRKEKNMTQKQLADKLHISYVNVSQLENGHRSPSVETINKLAGALGVSAAYLAGMTDDPGLFLNEQLREARKGKGMTQQDMADQLEISLEDYQRIESGQFDTRFLIQTNRGKVPEETILKQVSEILEVRIKLIEDAEPYASLPARLNHAFNQLNDQGQEKAVEYTEDLAENPKYKKDDTNAET